jgi:hypothetical protein
MIVPSVCTARHGPALTRSRLRPSRAQMRTAHGVGDAGRQTLAGGETALTDSCPLATGHRRSFRLYRGIALCAGFL